MSRPSLRVAIDAKCRDCGAGDAGSNWREHTTCCPVTGCPLWSVRPMSKNVPGWFASRDEQALPDDWRSLSLAAALATLRAALANDLQDSVTMSCGALIACGKANAQVQGTVLSCSHDSITKGGAA